jgi:hypothetical protein
MLKYVALIKDEKVKIQRYLSGFPSFISDKIQYDEPKTLEESIRRYKCLYDQQRGRPTFQNSWEDKMKIKLDQRKKGDNTPFFRENAQRQSTLKEPRMTKIVGKNPWKQFIKCWSCGRDHMHNNFPQRSD